VKQEVQAEVKEWAQKYHKLRAKNNSSARVVEAVVVPLFRSLERQWGEQGFKHVLGEETLLPVWFSTYRRQELERILEVY
jgi:hypothetical protein